jgi:hypothetical protein
MHRHDEPMPSGARLLDDMLTARSRWASTYARYRVERKWTASGKHRDVIWRGAGYLLSEAGLWLGAPQWDHQQQADSQQADLQWHDLHRSHRQRVLRITRILEFLLEPDPSSAYQPQVRLTAALPVPPTNRQQICVEDWPQHVFVDVALAFPEPGIRQQMFDLLCATDHPGLLDALEQEFASRVCLPTMCSGAGPRGQAAALRLWRDGAPQPFLHLILTNPHLPQPAHHRFVGGNVKRGMALLAALRKRLDLLSDHDQSTLANALLDALRGWLPDDARDLFRLAVRQLDAEQAIHEVRTRATPDEPEALVAAIDAGYLPPAPELQPILLFLTGQWNRYRPADPDGQLLSLLCRTTDPHADINTFVRWLLRSLRTSIPKAAATTARAALRDLDPAQQDNTLENRYRRQARDQLCAEAMRLDAEAVAAVTAARYMPSEPSHRLPFLFLTQQWDRYDADDPDGRGLYAHFAAHGDRYDPSWYARFRTVAKEAHRPNPMRDWYSRHKGIYVAEKVNRSRRCATTWPSSMGDFGFTGI